MVLQISLWLGKGSERFSYLSEKKRKGDILLLSIVKPFQ